MKKPPSHFIEYQQFLFRLTAKEPIILPAYKGSECSPTVFGRLF